mgnify:CR=1 FL=1
MNTFLYIVAALVVLIVILAIIAPKSYDVSRSIGINKPLYEVFSYLKYLKNQDHWSPWLAKDPDMDRSYTGTDAEVGFVSHWSGNKEVGVGEQEIKNIVENDIVKTELRFLKPFKSTSDAYIKVQKEGEGTNVIWGFSGKNKFPVSIMMLFMNMDKQVGKDFEEGLQKLKNILEG